MLKNVLQNKKLVIAILVILSIVIAIFLMRCSSQDKKEQTNNIPKNEIYEGEGLEVMEEDDRTVEDRVDTSGHWEDNSDSENQSHNQSTENNTDSKEKESNVSKESASSDENEVSHDEILVDEKTWGEVY